LISARTGVLRADGQQTRVFCNGSLQAAQPAAMGSDAARRDAFRQGLRESTAAASLAQDFQALCCFNTDTRSKASP